MGSVGLIPYINGPTHRSGHTLDLYIDRQNVQMLSDFKIVSSMPSDHYAGICSIAFPRPRPTRKAVKQRQLRKINMKAFNSDVLNGSLHSETHGTSTDVNSLTDNYNHVLREIWINMLQNVSQPLHCAPVRHGLMKVCEL